MSVLTREPPTPIVVASRGVPRRLIWALLIVVVWHGGLLMTGTFRGTYDALIHLFLADHYDRSWFSTWEQRWYTGFTTVSYPPGSHMALAAVAKVLGALDTSFVIVQLAALVNLTLGVYRFSRIWVDREAAANAALLLALSSAIAETVHLYGQLPTTFSLGFLLQAIPFIRRWIFEGRPIDLLAGTTVLAATTAGHHVTTLFGSVFFLGPVVVGGLLERSRVPRADEVESGRVEVAAGTIVGLVARRLRRVLAPLVRTAIVGPLALAALVIVVLPYWIWSATDPITQMAIPHGSRADFLAEPNLALVFWLIPWGPMLLVLPYAIVRSIAERAWPYAASLALLTLLGTGGTTPLPRMILGGAFDILTLDRFTFWATIMILPRAGQMMTSLEGGSIAAWLRATWGPALHTGVQVAMAVLVVGSAMFAATLAQFRPFQPEPIDPDPIVAFLEKDQHERWRYLTLGFGDQMAWISAHTTVTQVDGNYHSARRLPEMTSTSVERLEGAKYRGVDGLGSLQQFLEVPEKYHLKFVFSNDQFYDPLLHFTGWQRLGPLENGVVVWERADVEPLPAQLPVKEVPILQRLIWGIVPPTALVAGAVHILWWATGRLGWPRREAAPVPDERFLRLGLGRLDRVLNRLTVRLAGRGVTGPVWMERRRIELTQIRRWLARPPASGRRRLRRLAIVGVVAALLGGSLVAGSPDDVGPSEVIVAYHDHLDLRQWRQAYELLDPETRPDFELWRLQLSVTGGLLASYAKLDQIDVSVPTQSDQRTAVGESGALDATAGVDERVSAVVDLRYLTALDWLERRRSHEVVRRGGSWFLVADEPDLSTPPDQLVRRTAVDFLVQGRRRVTSATTELTDIQDRPELWVPEARLLIADGLPVIVGEVVNLDVDPADLTVTGVLRDDDGRSVVRYNATTDMIRQIGPRESTPFRIDFEEVAAGVDLDFDPLDAHPVEFDPDLMTSAEVAARAVVTSGGLDRGLELNSIAVTPPEEAADGSSGAWMLEGELRNDGVEEATVPLVLVSFFDSAGEVVWVEHHHLPEAIRSQRSGAFSVPIPTDTLATVEVSAIEPRVFHNGIAPADATQDPLGPVVDELPSALIEVLPEDLAITGIGVQVAAFHGGAQ